MRPPAHSELELRDVAEGRLRDEVVALCEQVQAILGGGVVGPAGRRPLDALLEAPLLHLRVLDDFLGTPPRGDAIGAQHYLPGRSPAPVLSRQERLDVDAILGLDRPRRALRAWDHTGITLRMCEALLGFVQHLERHPDAPVAARSLWFAGTRAAAHAFVLAERSPSEVVDLREVPRRWSGDRGSLRGSVGG